MKQKTNQFKKYKMRWTLLSVVILYGCNHSSGQQTIDSSVESFIKNQQFKIELFELAMCSAEVLHLIESDSLMFNMFIMRLQRATDPRLSPAQTYFHNLEMKLLLERINIVPNAEKLYPKSFAIIREMVPKKVYPPNDDFTKIFLENIEYPEDVDDACIIILLSDLPTRIWRQIEANKSSLYRINSWIEYGFEEFRYYPGTTENAKKEINSRIIEAIFEKNSSTVDPMIQRCKEMIQSVVIKYKD